MRINLKAVGIEDAAKKHQRRVLMEWAKFLSQEFDCSVPSAYEYVSTPSPANTLFVASYLRGLGWEVQAYHLPVEQGGETPSIGYVVKDNCQEYVRFKLTL